MDYRDLQRQAEKLRRMVMANPELSQSEIASRLATIETVLNQMNQRLFGNGQPGEISALKARITRLESWFWRAAGGGGVIFALAYYFWRQLR
jgi:hypothetical protein